MFIKNQKPIAQPNQLVSAETVLGKSLPASLEAERAVLGSLLLNDERIGTVAEMLAPQDFYHTAHRLLYQVIIKINQDLKRLDMVTLQDELAKIGMLEQVGGLSYIIGLQEDIPASGLLEQHATLVKEKATLRSLIGSATQIITQCYSQDNENIDVVLDEAEKTIFQISSKRATQHFVQLNVWLKKTFQHLSDLKNHGKGITGVISGYKKLDELTSGFQKGDLIVLAGRPSMGKTALALSLAANAAAHKFSVGFFSLEMPAEQLTLRLLSMESGIAHQHIRNASLTSDEWVPLTDAAARLAEMRFFIDDTAMLSIMDLRAKARKLKAEQSLDFLVIDYLQLLHSTKKHENRHQEVSEISRSLKALAKELNIPIIALAQLSRAVDSRMDKRPMLSDLRESGAIEQDADLIGFIYRDVVYNQDTENPALAELIVGKQRNGPTGTVFLHYARELTKFEDMEGEF